MRGRLVGVQPLRVLRTWGETGRQRVGREINVVDHTYLLGRESSHSPTLIERSKLTQVDSMRRFQSDRISTAAQLFGSL